MAVGRLFFGFARIIMTHASLPPISAFQRHFDAKTWQRGVAYAQDRAAEVLEVVPDDPLPGYWHVSADVTGSEPDPYEVAVTIHASTTAVFSVTSECTCPVEFDCKHGVAALITALLEDWREQSQEPSFTDPAPTPPVMAQEALPGFGLATTSPKAAPLKTAPPQDYDTLDRWLQTRDNPRSQEVLARTTEAESHRMVYVLRSRAHERRGLNVAVPDTGFAFWLCLWPAKVKPLKNKPGQWGKPSLLKTQYGDMFSESEGHGDLFKMVRRWLLGQTPGSYYGSYSQQANGISSTVKDAIGAHILEAALRSGDVVTLDPAGQIEQAWQWGDPRELTWTWNTLPEQTPGAGVRWKATADLGSLGCVLRLGKPALYMDYQTFTVGQVNTRQSAEQLADWLTLPPMPEGWMREHMPRLLSLAPPLPAAVVGELARVVQYVAPIPHLRVGLAPADAKGLLSLTLCFDYDGVQGVWSKGAAPQQWVDTAEGRVLLHRDPTAEFAWFNPLIDLGYLPVNDPAAHAPEVWIAKRVAGHAAFEVDPSVRDQVLLADGLHELGQLGFVITFDDALASRMHAVESLDMGLDAVSANGTVLEGEDESINAHWFSLSLGFEVDGQRVNLLPWLPQLLDHITHVKPREDDRLWLFAAPDQWWHVPVEPLRPWLATMLELVGDRQKSLIQGDALRLSRFEAMRLVANDNPHAALALSGVQAQSLNGLVQALKQGGGVQEVLIPEGLHAELRPYQRQGLAWLQFLAQHQLGGVLADDMGLGKTLQTIAHLWVEKQAGRLTHPALVVAPTSLMGNWRNELHRFAPGLRTLVLHGAQRSESFEDITHSDVVVTTYPLLSRDQDTLLSQRWSVVVLDEAQTIKNAKTQAAGIVQSLDARQRLCLSGTPMENHLGEIWSLFNFLMPGYLGSESRFKQLFRIPIEKQGDTDRMALLRARLAPFMLRRSKALVASELPPKIETIEHVTLAPAQAKLYETIRLTTEKKVREALSSKGLARSHITVLDALLKLRQVCCDPRLVPLASASKVKQSAKLDWLVENLPEMIAEGRRVLLFSQFTSMLDLIEEKLPALGLTWVKLTGQSTHREALIERFTSGEVPLFLISLKAGGVGLNLPQADTVIHYDPWWNPAVEEQATDRAHRLGQTQTVFVYKLVAEGTLEERILALQARKADLARGLYGEAGAKAAALTESDLNWLLQPLSADLSPQSTP